MCLQKLTFIIAPSPTEIFDRDLKAIWSSSVDIYIKEYEKCAFRFPDSQPCTSRPWKLHQQHTSAKGQFEPGPFLHEREWNWARKSEWIHSLRKIFSDSYEKIFLGKGHIGTSNTIEERLATERKLSRNEHWEMWKKIKSNKTCLSCLQAVPDHVLGCGHSYCPRCIQELGSPSSASECAWEMHCWLCWEKKGEHTHQIQLKPRCAGARILTLDGGGIRGIIELSVLQALHTAVGLGENFPIRDMFDLIVGTSTGGIISLGLAMSNSSITDMINFFTGVSEKTFSQTTAGIISRIGPLKKLTTYTLMILRFTESVFSSEPLKDGIKTFFKKYHPPETSLFAPALHSQPSGTRVAVTSAKDQGKTTCLITSYNHPLGNPVNDFEREEDSEKDMKVWEAALATSAAPFYLPPFEKKETNTQYVDGAVYANCPAEVAYGEMEKLWPKNGASLDYLVSLGTGNQKAKDTEAPTLVNLGFFVSIRAMFQRQLDSKSSWTKFEEQTAPLNVRSRLYRLDPPLNGEHVELYEYKRLQEIQDLATEWTKATSTTKIQELANMLIANLFFFEPDDVEAANSPVSSQRHLSDPSYSVLAGSIRCRLSHGSPQLEKLLGEMVEYFSYTQMGWENTAEVGRVQNWTKIEHPAGQVRLLDVRVPEPQHSGHDIKKFRLPFRFVVKKQHSMFHVLAIKLKRSKEKIAISGFPSTIHDLQRRSKMKWLQ
jgi:predicted acylesterase/phospholipase RssA